MAVGTVTTTTSDGNTILSVVPNDSTKITLNTRDTYMDKDIVINIADTKVTNTLATTTKTYLTGTATATTNTGTQNFDTGVYLTTTAGQVNATTYKVNEGAVIAYNASTGCLEVTT